MRKAIWSINVTLDGFIDHSAMIADEEMHQYYADELNQTDWIIFGRHTYQLMVDYWPTAAQSGTLNPGELAFADAINRVPKLVFSRTMARTEWNNTRLEKADVEKQVAALREQPGRAISIAGGALANHLMAFNLIDEFRFLIHPVVLGNGTPLFRTRMKMNLKLMATKMFSSGCVLLVYQPGNRGE